jgi:Aerotolerance regulator N-terminal/von Willebrand factor type A domain
MSFIQIGFLTALGALAIPIVIHLVFRQRARRADLGTLRFLRIVLEQNARRRHLMRWLLLALRLGCVALLALLFARPYWLTRRAASDKRTTVVLIDQSATMDVKQEGQRLVERATAAVHTLLSKADPKERFEIAFFDHAVHPLGSGGQAAAGRELTAGPLLDRLKAPEHCYGGTDYGAALEWARDALAKSPASERRLHIFTDLQQSGLAWTEVDALPADVVSQLHDLGRAATNNVAVTEARAERTWLRPQETTRLHATIYNGGPFTIDELPVVLRLHDGSKKTELRERIKVEAGASESLRFDLPPLTAGLWQGTVAIEAEDDLPIDNERHVAILASPPYQALLVDGRSATSPVLAATYFLEAALRLAPPGEISDVSPFEARQIRADESLPSLDKYDAVALADVGELSRGKTEQLKQFVARGGGLIVFGGENVTPQTATSLSAAGLAAGSVMGTRYATDLPLRLKTWDTKHPIFAAFSDPQLGDLARLAFSACTRIQPATDAKILATFRDDTPAVVERRLGNGSVVWLALAADRQWSDWTSSRLYLPLIYQLLGYQTGLSAGGRVRQGTLERAAAAADDGPPGIHARNGYTLVVNMSPRESETDRCSAEEFVNRFGLKLDTEAAGAAESAVATASFGTALIDSEIWPWLASLLLVVLVLEVLVANRTVA